MLCWVIVGNRVIRHDIVIYMSCVIGVSDRCPTTLTSYRSHGDQFHGESMAELTPTSHMIDLSPVSLISPC